MPVSITTTQFYRLSHTYFHIEKKVLNLIHQTDFSFNFKVHKWYCGCSLTHASEFSKIPAYKFSILLNNHRSSKTKKFDIHSKKRVLKSHPTEHQISESPVKMAHYISMYLNSIIWTIIFRMY